MVEKLVLRTPDAGRFGAFDLLGQIYMSAGDHQSARSAFLEEIQYARTGLPDSTGKYLGLINYLTGDEGSEPQFSERDVKRNFEDWYVDEVRTASQRWKARPRYSGDRVAALRAGRMPPPLFKAWWQFCR